VVGHVSAKRLRALPGGDVAAVAVRVRRVERVVVIDVAVRAGNDFAGWCQLVRTRQWPARCAVIKDRGVPGNGVVARRAVRCRERRSRRGVRWIIRRLPGCQMTLRVPAVRRSDRQAVIIVDVARRAGRYQPSGRQLVRVRQREARGRVIEGGVRPSNGVVA